MHGTGLWAALATLAGGGTVVLVDRPGLDAELVWDEVERHGVELLSIVGDVFARPLLAALDEHPDRWRFPRLRAILSSGVTWSPEIKAGLLRHLPRVTLLDSLGASEGMMSRSSSTAGDDIKPARFAVNERVRVLDEVTGRPVTPGSDEVGLIAVTGRIPLGYLNDPDKTAQTFRTFDGVRYSIPGDYGSVDADGTIRLLGRGSACINTGGEKVYPEEVELVLRQHVDVSDCVVLGVPDERFGERVVAVVQRAPGAQIEEADLDAWCRARLAGYKKPRRFVFVDAMRRSAGGQGRLPLPEGPRRRRKPARSPQPATTEPAPAGNWRFSPQPSSGRDRRAWRRRGPSPRRRRARRRRWRGPGMVATPALSVTVRGSAAWTKAARTRSATGRRPMREQSGSTTANSSPPSRAARSDALVRRASASATVRSTASPAGWPCSSFTALKWSTSNTSRLTGPLGARRAGDLEGERLLEEPAVGEPGEVVAGGELLDLVEQGAVAQRQARRGRPPARGSGASSSGCGPGGGDPIRRRAPRPASRRRRSGPSRR